VYKRQLLDAGALTYFYPVAWNPTLPTAPTWADAKTNWLLNHPIRYRPSAFPIVRDFHHADWAHEPNDTRLKKVHNLSWDLSVFWSIPEWESGYTP
jgi:hypothetical protein